MEWEWVHTLDDEGLSPLTRASQSGRFDVANLMLMMRNSPPPNLRNLRPQRTPDKRSFDHLRGVDSDPIENQSRCT